MFDSAALLTPQLHKFLSLYSEWSFKKKIETAHNAWAPKNYDFATQAL